MYEEFFDLKEKPFGMSPNPRFLFATHDTEEALACLTYGVIDRRGFIQLTGEVGTGKTTILKLFLDWLRDSRVPTAFVFNPRMDVVDFLDYMMGDFGIKCESPTKGQKLARLNQWLLERHRIRGTAVAVIDEAQDLSMDLLEEIRLLTNLETHSEKLLQIVLSGQPELEEKLRRPQLRQLQQRIALRCRTRPLTLDETSAYISSRLLTAGREGTSPFSSDAIAEIYRYSNGIQRIINLLCDHALINAYAGGHPWVMGEAVKRIASEFDLQSTAMPGRLPATIKQEQVQGEKELEDITTFNDPFRPLE